MTYPASEPAAGRRPEEAFPSLPAVAAVLLVAVIVYLPTLGHGFVWDDLSILMANQDLADWSRLAENLSPGFFYESHGPRLTDYWRPVVVLSHMADRALFGEAAWGPHLVNALLHGLTSLGVLFLGLAWTGRRRWALVAALLFAVHPVHVEAVAWVSGRSDLLMGLFLAWGLWADRRHGQTATVGWLAVSLGFFALALLSKESAVVFPLLVATRVVLQSCGETREGRSRGGTRAVAASLALVVILFWIRFVLLGADAPQGLDGPVDRWSLFWTWWRGFWRYLGLLVWPWRLTILHDMAPADGVPRAAVLAGLLAFLGLSWAAWTWRRRNPGLTFALAVFLVSLAPLSNFVIPVSGQAGVEFPLAERFLYAPSIGFCLALAWLLAVWFPRRLGEAVKPGRGRAVAAASIAVLLLLGMVRSELRIRDWRSDLTLFGAAVEDAPESYLAHLNYATALTGEEGGSGRNRRATLERAREHLVEARRRAPDNYRIHYNLGNLLQALGREGEASTSYRRALELEPTLVEARINLGVLLARSGDLESALKQFEAADRQSGGIAARVNRAHVLQALGRPQEAIRLYREVLARSPGLPAAQDGLRKAREALAGRESDAG